MAENNENVQQSLDLEETSEVEVLEETSNKEAAFVSDESENTEQQEYGASVQKRIDKLTKRMREAERQKEEAIHYAQGIIAENTEIKTRINALDKGYVDEYSGRVDAEEKQVEDQLRRAVEVSDTDATIEAQKKLTEIAVARDKVRQAKSAQDQQAAMAHQQQEAMAHQQQVPQQPSPARPDPMAEEWAGRPDNSWFGKDEAMTFATFGIHKKMVEADGFDPRTREYYDEVDRRLRDTFPNKFDTDEITVQNTSNNEPAKRNVQTVAGNNRSTNTGRSTKVRLTPSQKDLARRLRVPVEEYAKSVLKLERERQNNS